MKSKRLNRQSFWHIILLLLGVELLTTLFVMKGGLEKALYEQFLDALVIRHFLAGFVGWPILLFLGVSLVIAVISTVCMVRRLHDIGQSGWGVLWGLVPLIGQLVLLAKACLPGHPQENPWGQPTNATPLRSKCRLAIAAVMYIAAALLWMSSVRDSVFIASNLRSVSDWGRMQQIAERGNKYACYLVARYYASGRKKDPFKMVVVRAGQAPPPISDQDQQTAVKWMKKAAQAGLPIAQSRMGDLYMEGKWVKKSKKKANFWYMKAAAQGSVSAKQSLKQL